MEPFNYYRPAMDFYGSDPYYYHTTGMSAGGGETFPYGLSTVPTGADPHRNDASYWPNRDVGSTIPWDTTIFNGGFDPRMMPSAWTYDYYNNQPHAETATNHQQPPGTYVDNETLPITVTQKSDGGYITPEYSVDYQNMSNVLPGIDHLPITYTNDVRLEPTVCKTEMVAMEYGAPTPPLSPPYEELQLDHSNLMPSKQDSESSTVPVLFEIKILPDLTHTVDVDSSVTPKQPATPDPDPPKHSTTGTKRKLKTQLKTEWSCHECNKCFIRRLGLVQHNAIKHAGDRPFGCSKCGKRFANAALLDEHSHRHRSTDKPFKCDVCPKQFFYRMDLIRHDYKHSGKSPHVCAYCSKIFSRQDHLRRHEFIHKRQSSADDDNAES